MKRRYTIPIFLIIFCLWTWSVFIEPYFLLNEKHAQVVCKNFPKGFENLKIAVVSDIHLGRGPLERMRFKKIVDAVNANSPDIILFLGDYTNGYYYQTSLSPHTLINTLSQFNAKITKLGILGNHDAIYGVNKIKNVLSKSGITPICNSNQKVSTPYGDFYVAGIADPQTLSYSYSSALKNIPKNAPTIFLTHNPAVVREIPHKVDLVLAGHTHGGQLRLPYIGNIFPLKNTPRKLTSGLSNFNNHAIYTSMGLGTSRFPIRFYCAPEFTILKIIPKN